MLLAWATLTITLCVITPLRADSSSDFRDYWRTALHYRETGEISSELGVHNYLPFFTIFMTPWSYLPLEVAIVVFTLLSMTLLAIIIVMVEALLNGGIGHAPRAATWLAFGLMLAYVVSSGVLGAIDLLVLFLVVSCWFLFEHGRAWEAGLPLGLAIVIKIIPAALVLFFLLKGRWRTAASAVALAALLGLGWPLARLGYRETVRLHSQFQQEAVAGHSARTTIFADAPRKAKFTNSSLPIVLRRVLTHTDSYPSPEPKRSFYVNALDLPRNIVWYVYLVLAFVILAASIAATLRGRTAWPPGSERDVTKLRAQFGVWCCLLLLASPLVWTRYLLYAYWPVAWWCDRLERTAAARGRASVSSLIATGAWLAGALALTSPPARAAGAQLLAVAVVWAMLLPVARRGRTPV